MELFTLPFEKVLIWSFYDFVRFASVNEQPLVVSE